MDLNIIARDCVHKFENPNLLQQIKTAFKLGYEVVALNTIIDGVCLEGKDVKFPEPLSVQLGTECKPEILLSKKHYKVLNRLTAIVGDNYHIHRMMQSPITKKYDLIAFQPTNLKIFQHLCAQLDFDIISFDLTMRIPFHLKHNNCRQAMQSGIHFEIQYSPCIRNSSDRKMVLANGNNLVEVLRGNKVIISSGSDQAFELRSPKDIANLGYIFGLSKQQANASVKANCKTVLIHSEVRRKTGFGVVSIEKITDVAPSEKWLKDACTYLTKLEEDSSEQATKKIKIEKE